MSAAVVQFVVGMEGILGSVGRRENGAWLHASLMFRQ
jgi:hypothetical protein